MNKTVVRNYICNKLSCVSHRIEHELGIDRKAWIGLTKSDDSCDEEDLDCTQEGWKWADGATYDPNMHMWADEEPKQQELCGLLHKTGVRGSSCESHKHAYICEKGTEISEVLEIIISH